MTAPPQPPDQTYGRAGPAAPPALAADLRAGFAGARAATSLPIAALRLLRSLRAAPLGELRARLSANPAFARHQAALGVPDPLFYLSHRHYLARGLAPRDRALAAVAHYEHEVATFDDAYLGEVYGPRGLLLWSRAAGDVTYDLRLTAGQDVLYEGGLSVVLRAGPVRACVLSFSVVPAALLLPGRHPEGAPSRGLPFVTRSHLAADRAYQAAFYRAFDRVTPTHLSFGALEGVLLAQGWRELVGLAPERHPSWTPARAETFRAAYEGLWRSLSGEPASPLGSLVALPMRMTPLQELDAARRKRALARRGHIEAARDAALAALRPHLLAAPGPGG